MCSVTYFVKWLLEKFHIQISQFLLKMHIYWQFLIFNKLLVLLHYVLARADSHCQCINSWLQKVMLEIMAQSNHSFTSNPLLHLKLLCSSHTYFIHSPWVSFCLLYSSPTKILGFNKNISQIYRNYCWGGG